MKECKDSTAGMFLFLIIEIILISLFVSPSSSTTIMINAQPSYTGFTSGNSNNSISGKSDNRQVGICVVGAGGPCNGDSNWDGKDDKTGKCILSNGCDSRISSSSIDNNNNVIQNKTGNMTLTNSSSNSDGLMLK